MVRLVSRFFALAALVCAALAKPMSERAMAVHDRRPAPARGFVNSGSPSAGKQLTLRLALKQNNIAGLEKKLYAVSDPASVEYGQHLSADEVAEFVKPTADTLSSVTAWLAEHDLSAKPVSHPPNSPSSRTLTVVKPPSAHSHTASPSTCKHTSTTSHQRPVSCPR
ncbi:Pro-kumamolisin, activation domain-containing protein [Favolaschia claudopus]|uniref:Pro-kumamolisin, activation domain-containing protein n=1 Tax=Favolaschia claudopus TaxID=2862362 RepID=A0AAW0DZK9_9AGAR